MAKNSTVDARPDQLKLLKLEKRKLRPMATTVLSQNASKKMKITAIAGVAASIAALQTAPNLFEEKLQIGENIAKTSASVMMQACLKCEEVAQLIQNDQTNEQIYSSLEELFLLVDDEHLRLERAAIKAGARLLPVNESPDAIGTGGKNKNAQWLKAIGTGGKDKNVAWLEEQQAIGTGGKDKNQAWLSRHKI